MLKCSYNCVVLKFSPILFLKTRNLLTELFDYWSIIRYRSHVKPSPEENYISPKMKKHPDILMKLGLIKIYIARNKIIQLCDDRLTHQCMYICAI